MNMLHIYKKLKKEYQVEVLTKPDLVTIHHYREVVKCGMRNSGIKCKLCCFEEAIEGVPEGR